VTNVRGKPAQLPRKSRSNQPAATFGRDTLLDAAICFSLIVAIFAVYAQVSHFDFINIDDQEYVYENAHVKAGLTLENIKWAFTTVVNANWAPVTMLSHILDCQFFGMESGMHHLVNVIFHALASLLLFVVLQRATGARWPSAFVAFIFALHPLHVESVAWVAERKDVLSALFWFLGLYAYVRYAEAPDLRRYLMVAAPFCLGLLSKAMLVTFPFTLLLFDVWPLRRARFPKVLWEKVPLIAISAVFSVVTYLAQRSSGAVWTLPLKLRVENSLVSYVSYIGQMFWPTRLVWYYLFPDSIPAWQSASAAVLLLAVSALAIFMRRTHSYFIAGWLWYLGMLVPVIGLVQVGQQAHADRYMYLPMVGLLWILGWGAADVVKKWPSAKAPIAAAAIFSCVVCAALCWRQAGYWRDSMALYQHGFDVSQDNLWARYNLAGQHYILGGKLMNSGHGSEAMGEFEETLRLKPNYAEAHNDLGILLAKIPGRSADAAAHFEAALRIDPRLLQAHRNLGMLLASVPGRTSDAITQLEEAQRLQPDPELAQLIHRLQTGQK
jgi:tetratricopeptide (TPR) repeat protein